MNRRRNYEENPLRVLLISVALTLFLALCVVWAVRAQGQGLRVEVGIGQARYGLAGDSIWYDQTYPHANDLSALGSIVGLSGDWTPHLGWRAWIVDFGKISNGACWPNDPDYFKRDGAAPIYQGQGSGYAYGLAVGPTLDFGLSDHWHIGLEAGALLYRARWDESVRELPSGPWINADSFSASGVTRSGSTWYDGLIVRYSNAFLSVRRYADVGAKDALFGNALRQVVLGASVPY